MNRFTRQTILFGLVATAGLGATSAEARPYAPKMSCSSLQSLLKERGALVISTGPNTYDRYVSDSRYCQRTQRLVPEWIQSADKPDCGVGYTCKEYMRD
ncbi:MAG: hypothetical protein ABW275_00495, partial [Hansschlegelia sp.]